LSPGVHVIGNVDPTEEPAPKADRIAGRVAGIAELEREQALSELARVCRGHEMGGSIADTCVHLTEARGSGGTGGWGGTRGAYGTRSSTLVAIGEDAGDSRLLYSDGPPSENEYQDLSTLFRELSQSAGYESGETPVRNGS
jgi:hypothetical protein